MKGKKQKQKKTTKRQITVHKTKDWAERTKPGVILGALEGKANSAPHGDPSACSSYT